MSVEELLGCVLVIMLVFPQHSGGGSIVVTSVGGTDTRSTWRTCCLRT